MKPTPPFDTKPPVKLSCKPWRLRGIGLLSGLILALLLFWPSQAYAFNFSVVNDAIVAAFSDTPTLLSMISYLLGGIVFFYGLLKLRDHVEAPQQTTLTSVIGRLAAGAVLIALPWAISISVASIGGQDTEAIDIQGEVVAQWEPGGVAEGIDLRYATESAVKSFSNTPTLLSMIAYVLGAALMMLGIYMLKMTAENPDQVTMKHTLLALFAGALLIALPFTINVTAGSIGGARMDKAIPAHQGKGTGTFILQKGGSVDWGH